MGDANSSGSESSALGEGQFVIEAIRGHRKVNGIYEYELKWDGFESDENTWQTADTFNDSSIQLLEDYNRQHKVGMKKKKEEKKQEKSVRTPPKKRQFYEEKSESDSEKKADWFVSPDAEHKEIKGLYVQDRILTSSEQLLAAVTQDDWGVRRTRSVMRQLMGDDRATKPKRKRTATSAAPASRKRAASPKVPKKSKKRTSDPKTPPKKRARRSKETSGESSDADESSAAEESNETLDGSGGKESDDDDCVILDDVRTETPESVASTSTVENRRPAVSETAAPKKKVEKPKEKSKEKSKEKRVAEKPPVQKPQLVEKPPPVPKQPAEKPRTPEVFRIPKKKKWNPFVDVHAEPAACKPTNLASNLASSHIPIFAPTKASGPQRPVVNQPPAIGSNVRTSFVASTPRPREVPKEKPNPPPSASVQSTAADLLALVSKDSRKAQEPRVTPIVAANRITVESPPLSSRDPRRVQTAAAPPPVVHLTPPLVHLSVGCSTPNGPPVIPPADNNNQTVLTYADLEKYALEGNLLGVQAALNSRLAYTFDYSVYDVGRRTLLHRVAGKNCSVQHEYDEILACLVSQKASMEVIDGQRGQTALHIAVCNRHACLVRKLVELGSPINTVDREGFSPLGAALKLHPPVAAELLRQGANFSSVLENANLRFTPAQLQPVHDFVHEISTVFARTQEEILSDQFAKLCPISTIHQVRMGESNIFEFSIPFCTPNSCEVSFVMFARPQYVGERIHSVEMKGDSPVEKVFLDGVSVLPFSPVNHYIFLIKQQISGQYPHRMQVVVDPNAVGPLWIQLLASKKEAECSDPQPVPPPPVFDYGQ